MSWQIIVSNVQQPTPKPALKSCAEYMQVYTLHNIPYFLEFYPHLEFCPHLVKVVNVGGEKLM